MRKLKIYSELAFPIGLILLAIGIVFLIKANFGLSVVQSNAYILSIIFPKFSFGVLTYLVQLFLVLILCIIIKKFSIRYFFSFLSGVVYGYLLNLFAFLMRNVTATTIMVRILFFVAGFILVVFAVIMFFRTNIPLMPYDIFVTDLAKYKNWNVNTVKIIFDLACLLLALSTTLLFFKKLVGIGIGTIITGLFSGICIKYIGDIVDKFFTFEPLTYYKEE